MEDNGFALGEEADFVAQNCLPVLNLIRSIKLQLSTEPAILQSPFASCTSPFKYSYLLKSK